jgi:hypothetical protein
MRLDHLVLQESKKVVKYAKPWLPKDMHQPKEHSMAKAVTVNNNII